MKVSPRMLQMMRRAGYVPVSALVHATGLTEPSVRSRVEEQHLKTQSTGSFLFVEVQGFADSLRDAPTLRAAVLSLLEKAE